MGKFLEVYRSLAGQTQDEALRRGWLENVRANRTIVAEWNVRQGRAAAD